MLLKQIDFSTLIFVGSAGNFNIRESGIKILFLLAVKFFFISFPVHLHWDW